MAIITFSPGWGHVRGHLGGFVYKLQQGKDILADKPDREPPRDSPAQLAQQDRFRQATVYAKGTKHDAGAYAVYQAKAKERRSNPFAVAIHDWMNAPEVTAIDLSGYAGHAGDVIWVTAEDDIGVTGVAVAIEDGAHTPVEGGAATFDPASGLWKYTATVEAPAKSGLTVKATASDRPGHTGTLAATK